MHRPDLKSERGQAGETALAGLAILFCIALAIAIIIGIFFGIKAVARYQDRADRNQNRTQARYDANNDVLVNQIKIRTYQQRVKIAKQQADIRYQTSVGIKRAQDEISKTLTPLYVQFEEIDALRQIAVSGRNATVIYVPIGTDGKPIVSQVAPAISAKAAGAGG